MNQSMNTENIRHAVIEDLSQVLTLYKKLIEEEKGFDSTLLIDRGDGEERLKQRISQSDQTLLVADIEGSIKGFLLGAIAEGGSLRTIARLGLIEGVFVETSERDVGIGGRLVDKFTSWARAHGATRIQVTISAENSLSEEFFRHFSFTPYRLVLERNI